MKRLRFLAALWIGKCCALLIRAAAPAKGSNKSGEIALRLCPGFLAGFSGIAPEKTFFITGTNGKSTSNNLIVHAFRTAGRSVTSNLEGANMKPGVATALLKNASPAGRLKSEYLILEVDERSLAAVRRDLPAKYICVTNIQKDQVQRNGDPDYIYQKIKAVIDKSVTVFVNNEEPRSKSLGWFAERAITFGVRQNERGSGKESDFGVTLPCPVCRDALIFSAYNLANVGPFYCPSCGFASEGASDYCIDGVDYENGVFTVMGESYRLAYSAAHFLYNYVLCCAVGAEAGLTPGELRAAFSGFTNIGGRLEDFAFGDKRVRYIRMKQENPETLQSVLDVMAADPEEKVFMVGLEIIHDIIPYYSNTFYAFDCNFGPFADSGVERCICFGDTVCFDAANRLRYAGVPEERISVLPTGDAGAILKELAACRSNNVYLITPLKEYEGLRKAAEGTR
jgi:UDP-N-acetylmuramyl tripeptide synthase